MYLSKITSDGLKKLQPDENVYETHQIVWKMFPHTPYQKIRNFLYFFFNGDIYLVSKKKPALLPVPQYNMQTKPYDLNITNGMVLQFDVRINAQICRQGKKISIMTALADDLREQNKEYNLNYVAHESSLQWLDKFKRKFGFVSLDHQITAFRHIKFRKPENHKMVRYMALDLTGALRVTNSNVFKRTLYEGIGQTRAFGCGLMLVAPYRGV